MADSAAMTGVDLQTENVAHLIQLALGPVFLIPGRGEMNRFGPPPGVVAQEPAAG